MRIVSPLSPAQYIDAMKEQMGSHMDFANERFTGFFLGRVFDVTFHSGYEYDRRFNFPMNSALGYVVKKEHGCEVRFIRLKGFLNPPHFLFMAVLCFILCLLLYFADGLLYDPFDIRTILLQCAGIGFGVVAVVALMSAIFESTSHRSAEGGRFLLSFLLNPTDPYANF